MGNEYLTAACADTKIMHFVKIVEGGEKPEEGSDSKKQFDGEIDSNISALVARICIMHLLVWAELSFSIWAAVTYEHTYSG